MLKRHEAREVIKRRLEQRLTREGRVEYKFRFVNVQYLHPGEKLMPGWSYTKRRPWATRKYI